MGKSSSSDFLVRLPEVMPMARLQGSSQYGFKWSYASVVVEKGPRKGANVPVGK